jgi:hypothetical protein
MRWASSYGIAANLHPTHTSTEECACSACDLPQCVGVAEDEVVVGTVCGLAGLLLHALCVYRHVVITRDTRFLNGRVPQSTTQHFLRTA